MKHGLVCKSQKGYKLARPNPSFYICSAVPIDGVSRAVDYVGVLCDSFRVQGEGGEEKDGFQVWSPAPAGGGDSGGEHGDAPPQDVEVQLRSAKASGRRGGKGGELGGGVVARRGGADCHGSLPVLVSVFLV